eukprot:scaffold36181_cov41-Attheya_sp.AAC.1
MNRLIALAIIALASINCLAYVTSFTVTSRRRAFAPSPWTIQPLKNNHKAVSALLKISNVPEELPEETTPSQPIDELKSLGSDMQQKFDLDRIVNIGFIALIVAALVFHASNTLNNMDTSGWTVDEIALRIPSNIWNEYETVLKSDPILTKAVTSGSVYAIGDFISQKASGADIGNLDRGRLVRSSLADVLHWTSWWTFFPEVFTKPNDILADMKRTTIPLIISGLKLWPLAHCITYGLIPIENRLLWVDFVEIIWVTILATQAAGGKDTEKGEASQ